MIPKDSDGFSDGDYDNPGDLGWSEFDWEKYLRSEDDVIHRYLGFYEQMKNSAERIDDVAQLMGWDADDEADEAESEEAGEGAAGGAESDMEPYILQKNPVFIATTAIYLSLQRNWERLATDPRRVPQSLAVGLLSSFHRGEMQAILAVQSLDLGDYTLAISLFKRAMKEINVSLNYLNTPDQTQSKGLLDFRDEALPRLFDLREVWLRVIAECREEVARHGKNGGDDENAG